MRRIRAWGMLAAMCLFVFAVSGCGGGSLDGNVGDNDNTSESIPNNEPDSYNTAEVLAGEWSVLSDSNTISTLNLTRNQYTIQMRLISARMNLDDVLISGNGGSLSVKESKQEWYVLLTTSYEDPYLVPYIDDEDGQLKYRLALRTLYSYDSDTVSSDINSSVLMTRSGKDKWRFEFIKDNNELNKQATAMNIEITSETTIHVKQQDIITVASFDVFYETEFDMRKVSDSL